MDPTERFSNRVDDYARFRPRYPASLIRVLEEEVSLGPEWVIADIGSGTGFSTEPFLDHGNTVFAIEPNPAMRRAAEERLGGRPGFRSIDGSAEETGLDDESVDLAVAGQAFHWFDQTRARNEFVRILRPPKWVALFWNTRHLSGNPFNEGYEALLLRFGTDYEAVRHDRMDRAVLESFFGGGFIRRAVPNDQVLELEALEGRLRSASYTPTPGEAGFRDMFDALRDLFDEHQTDGRVTMSCETEIFIGALDHTPISSRNHG